MQALIIYNFHLFSIPTYCIVSIFTILKPIYFFISDKTDEDDNQQSHSQSETDSQSFTSTSENILSYTPE